MAKPMTHHSEPAREAVAEPMFPIMGGPKVPWSLIAPYEAQAQTNHGQTLKRLAERGGLSICEAMAVMSSARYEKRPIAKPTVEDWLDFIAERKVRAERRASPAPAAGGLEAVRGALRLAEGRLELLLREFPDESATSDHPVATRYVLSKVKAGIAALASPAATSAETQGGDGVREALSRLEKACDGLAATRSQATYLAMIDNDKASDALSELDEARRHARHVIAALALAASAATRGEAMQPAIDGFAANAEIAERIFAPAPEKDGRPDGWTEAIAISFMAANGHNPEMGMFAKSFNEGAWREIEQEWPEFEAFANTRIRASLDLATDAEGRDHG